MGAAWYATGTYVNDDGATTNLKGNYNQYSIAAMADAENPTSISIEISMYYTAYNYLNKMQTNCSAVNSNDFLGNVYIYNAKNFKAMSKFTVVVVYTSGETAVMGEATYDSVTDRLVFKNTAQLCLSTIKTILLNKYM